MLSLLHRVSVNSTPSAEQVEEKDSPQMLSAEKIYLSPKRLTVSHHKLSNSSESITANGEKFDKCGIHNDKPEAPDVKKSVLYLSSYQQVLQEKLSSSGKP